MKTEQKWIIGDCLELLPEITDKSIDMILTDLPYGTTACKWDVVIPFEPLWKEYERIIKDNGAIVLTASQPFTSNLILSNLELFKYELIWDKVIGGDFLNAKNKPMKSHENICIFSKGTTANKSQKIMKYNPQMREGKPYKKIQRSENRRGTHAAGNRKPFTIGYECLNNGDRYPLSILAYSKQIGMTGHHPTQKPVALFEYLIKTYTNEGDTVHDSCLGSGTTLEACLNTNRNCIGFEISNEWEEHYIKRLRLDNTKLDAWNDHKLKSITLP